MKCQQNLVTRGDIFRLNSHPAVFWIQNPQNTITNNIAVSSVNGSGFEFAIPLGKQETAPLGGKVNLRSLPILEFAGNEAHSNRQFGVRAYRFKTGKPDETDCLN